MTVVKLEGREKNILKISGLDMLEGTPILDIKPYTPRELKEDGAYGWLDHLNEKE
jgi:tRNA (Thr-GGU) A37 N-methylase